MRILAAMIAPLIIGLFANGFSSAGAADPSEPSLTIQEARKLSDAELSDRLAAMLARNAVDLDRPHPSDDTLRGIGLAFRPSTSWRGLCEAQIVHFGFQRRSEHPQAGQSLKSLSGATRYKIRANPDENSTDDDAQLAARCAGDHPFDDGYFFAPDGRTAQNAGFVVLNARAQARSGRVPFALGCTPRELCRSALNRIGASSTDRIISVSEMERCRQELACIEINFLGSDHCYEVWSVTGRYRAPPGKEWGMIVPIRINLKIECPQFSR
jgi:hypothetical protein